MPLYFAAERPVVERDGTLIMVDDERMPLAPGEAPVQKKVRFRTLGCYPLTGAVESDADTLPAIIQEMLADAHLRAPGPRDRPRLRRARWRRRSRRATSDVAHVVRPDQRATSWHTSSRTSSKSMLRFITCGSVDDGKSTLIGRLLYESQMLFEDQLAALERTRGESGTQGDELDFALLLDGLGAEREQGITIDVAYRYFSTDRRKFIVADTPGHEQYTRNMVTGASTADCAVVLIDARKGVLTQTRRHSYLVSLIGIRHVVLAVNKMDLVDYSEERFREIEQRVPRASPARSASHDVTCIPLSGLTGENVVEPSERRCPGTTGPTLMEYLEAVELDEERMQLAPFRMPVQWVNRPNLDFRGFAGTIAGGAVAPGDRVVVLPSGQTSEVARIVTYDGDLERAVAGPVDHAHADATRSTSAAAT